MKRTEIQISFVRIKIYILEGQKKKCQSMSKEWIQLTVGHILLDD